MRSFMPHELLHHAWEIVGVPVTTQRERHEIMDLAAQGGASC